MAEPVKSCNEMVVPPCTPQEVPQTTAAPAVGTTSAEGATDAYSGEGVTLTATSSGSSPVPFATRMHQPPVREITPSIDRGDPRFLELVAIARKFFTGIRSYPSMTDSGYTLIYGPLADVAPADAKTRAHSTMWNDDRIHTWLHDVTALFGSLSIAAAEGKGKRAVFTIKHAPGYGYLRGGLETINEPPRDKRPLQQVARDFEPFRTLFDRFGPKTTAVMVGGAVLEAVDPEHPSVFSRETVRWIRANLGPHGDEAVLVTDDINTAIFSGYIKGQMGYGIGGYPPPRFERLKFIIKTLVKADVDIILDYGAGANYGGLMLFAKAGRELLAEGAITRKELERSVKRILRMKARIYPDHPLLKDIDATIAAMTDEQLLWQKLVVPCTWGSEKEQSRYAADFGVGMTMEGLEDYLPRVRRYAGEAVEKATTPPPFLANNSPQELAGLDNKGDNRFRSETKFIHEFTKALQELYPDGVPAGFMDALYEEVTGQSKMLASVE